MKHHFYRPWLMSGTVSLQLLIYSNNASGWFGGLLSLFLKYSDCAQS